LEKACGCLFVVPIGFRPAPDKMLIYRAECMIDHWVKNGLGCGEHPGVTGPAKLLKIDKDCKDEDTWGYPEEPGRVSKN
jgi:hypothetical protein